MKTTTRIQDLDPRCREAWLQAGLGCVGQGHAKQLRLHGTSVAASSQPVHNITTEPHKIAQRLMQHRLHHWHRGSQSPMLKVIVDKIRLVTVFIDIACSAHLPYTTTMYMPCWPPICMPYWPPMHKPYWPQMHLPCWPLPCWPLPCWPLLYWPSMRMPR